MRAESEKAEAAAVVREVVSLVGGTDLLSAHSARRNKAGLGARANYSFGEIAVLYRTGRQLDALEEAFAKAGLPYKVVGEKKLLYTKELRETVTFFHALLEPEDYFLLSALHLEVFNPGAEHLERLWASYLAHRVRRPDLIFLHFLQALLTGALNLPELPAGAHPGFWGKLQYFYGLYQKYAVRLEDSPLAVFTEWVTDCQWDERKKEVQELFGLAAFSADLREFFTRLQVGREGDLERLGIKGPAPEYINLMTIHAAKGLEYPAVLITGLEEGLLPLLNSAGETELEEERRLFYVGLTRARRELVLFQAKRRRRFGATEKRVASRFLGEIPPELLCYEESGTMRRKKHQQKGLFILDIST
ncbi:MAG TPA: 3'-5' exonuclease [Bacillota bacterium]